MGSSLAYAEQTRRLRGVDARSGSTLSPTLAQPLTQLEAIASGELAALEQLVLGLLGPRPPEWIILDERGERTLGAARLGHPARTMALTFGGRQRGWLLLAEKTPLYSTDQAIGASVGLALALYREGREVQAHTERFRLIAQVAALVGSQADLETLLVRAADAIHERLGYANVDIPLLDDAAGELVIRVRGGSYKAQIQGEDRLPVGQGIMGCAASERRTQRVNDTSIDPRYQCPPGVIPARAELAVPIMHGAEVLGVLNVEGQRPFDDLDTLSMEIIAEHLASAIHAARLNAQVRQAAVMRERQRLARELHDNVTQLLSSVNLIGQSLGAAWARDADEGARRTARLQELLRQSLQEMRVLMRELSPGPQASPRSLQGEHLVAREQLRREGLATTLQRLLTMSTPESLRVRFDFGAYQAQPIELEETLLRIAQEAIRNAIRHARASQLTLSGRVDDAMIELIIADDGRGIDPRARHGRGLQNMRDRAIEAGGRLQLQANHPAGTRVIARFPVSRGQPEAGR
jgi:signal transduction histidine kinase